MLKAWIEEGNANGSYAYGETLGLLQCGCPFLQGPNPDAFLAAAHASAMQAACISAPTIGGLASLAGAAGGLKLT